jgi:hypothetical protein
VSSRHSQRGQTLPLVALMLTVLFGFVALAVEWGAYRVDMRAQQTATDAAAIAGASHYFDGTAGGSASIAAAKQAASQDGFTDGTANVTVSPDPTYTGITGAAGYQVADAVHVTITKTYATAFGAVIGNPNVTVTTSAVADDSQTANGQCVYALTEGVTDNLNSGIMNLGCNMTFNGSTLNLNGATIVGTGKTPTLLNVVGSVGGSSYSTTNVTLTTGTAPVSDPCSEILTCAYAAANPPSGLTCTNYADANKTVAPITTPVCLGTGSSFKNDVVTFIQGSSPLIEIQSGAAVNFSGATVTGSGVTLYIESGASMNTNTSGTEFQITAPTNGTSYDGIAIYQVPGNTNALTFNKNSNDIINGIVYAPNADFSFTGAVDAQTEFIVGQISMNGSLAYPQVSSAVAQHKVRLDE